MEIIKKYKELIILALIIAAGSFFFFYQNDNKAIFEFNSSYKRFDKTITYFTVPVYIPDNFGKNQNLLELDNIHSQIAGNFNESASTGTRLELAKRALLLNMNEIENLSQTNILEAATDNALIELSRKAAVIKDDNIRNVAIEISDIAKKEMNNIIAYRNVMQEKRNYTNDFLQKIVDDNGGLIKLLSFIKQEENSSKVDKQNEALDRLSKEFGVIKRDKETAYARFRGLTGIKN